jgi:phosphonate transport system permease protein
MLIATALVISAVGAEVRPVTLWNHIGNFTSYFDRLLKLDTGARVWTDPQEWFGVWRGGVGCSARPC